MKFYILFLITSLILLIISACKDGNSFGYEYQPVVENEGIESIDNVKPTITINEKGNPMTMTVVYAGLYTETHKATFDSNDMCSSYIVTEEYKSSALADVAWAEYQDDMDDKNVNYSRNGKTITIDMSSKFKGMDRQYVLMVFDVHKANIEREYSGK